MVMLTRDPDESFCFPATGSLSDVAARTALTEHSDIEQQDCWGFESAGLVEQKICACESHETDL